MLRSVGSPSATALAGAASAASTLTCRQRAAAASYAYRSRPAVPLVDMCQYEAGGAVSNVRFT